MYVSGVVFLGPYPSLMTLTRCTLYSVPHTLLFPGRLIREGATQLTYIFLSTAGKRQAHLFSFLPTHHRHSITTQQVKSRDAPPVPSSPWPALRKKNPPTIPVLPLNFTASKPLPPSPFSSRHREQARLRTREPTTLASSSFSPGCVHAWHCRFAGTGLGQVGSSRLSQRTGAKARRANSQQRKRAQKLEKWPPPLSARTAPVRPCTALPRPRESFPDMGGVRQAREESSFACRVLLVLALVSRSPRC